MRDQWEQEQEQEQGPATRTIDRAMAILHAFDASAPELGVTELSRRVNIDKSTVYRLLSALQQGGLIEQNPATAKYHLGLGLLRLSGLAQQSLDLPRVARPYLLELAEVSEETVNLSLMTADDKIMNIDGVTSPHRVRNVGWIGREMPAHAVSGGKVVLAFLEEEKVDEILARGLPRLTPHTVVDPAELRAELAQIRKVGYGLAQEELEEGLSAVAAPIWNHEGRVIAIFSVSGPSFRLPKARLEELGRVTKRMAGRVSETIGFTP
jgi:DNA-binding IclR family transcriptional regulator